MTDRAAVLDPVIGGGRGGWGPLMMTSFGEHTNPLATRATRHHRPPSIPCDPCP
jgi:hypothetical protein